MKCVIDNKWNVIERNNNKWNDNKWNVIEITNEMLLITNIERNNTNEMLLITNEM